MLSSGLYSPAPGNELKYDLNRVPNPPNFVSHPVISKSFVKLYLPTPGFESLSE